MRDVRTTRCSRVMVVSSGNRFERSPRRSYRLRNRIIRCHMRSIMRSRFRIRRGSGGSRRRSMHRIQVGRVARFRCSSRTCRPACGTDFRMSGCRGARIVTCCSAVLGWRQGFVPCRHRLRFARGTGQTGAFRDCGPGVQRRGHRGHTPGGAGKGRNAGIAVVRSEVGCVFAVRKRCCGPGRIRFPGLAGNMTFRGPAAIASDIREDATDPHPHGPPNPSAGDERRVGGSERRPIGSNRAVWPSRRRPATPGRASPLRTMTRPKKSCPCAEVPLYREVPYFLEHLRTAHMQTVRLNALAWGGMGRRLNKRKVR